ncbi:MAG: ArgR family transcriptional regulator, partial [Gemmatimonas sp.]|nr:ArgR family transcriptional regulator [Gemmatimonas sp.]
MSDKSSRHAVIRDIVTAHAVSSQEELRKQLTK